MGESPRSVRSEELLARMGWLQALVRGLLSDPGLAEDVAQDVWILATERPPREREGPGLKSWLASVARTLARQSVRSSERRMARERVAARSEAVSTDPSVVERGAMQERVVRAVMELEEPYRSTILHRYLDGLSAVEIARREGDSPALVRKRIERGLQQLRIRLDSEFGGHRRSWGLALLPMATSGASTSVTSGVLSMANTFKLSAAHLAVIAATLAASSYVVWRIASGTKFGEALSEQGEAGSGATDRVRESEAVMAAPSRVTVSDPSRGFVEPSPEAPSEVDDIAERLNESIETFLTDRPDFDGLGSLLDQIGRSASVVPDSVVTERTWDGNPTGITGTIAVQGTCVGAEFRIRGSQARIEIRSAPASMRPPFLGRDLTLLVGRSAGADWRTWTVVQFHPDSRLDPGPFLAESERKLVGWTVAYDANGSSREPLTMRRAEEPGAWRIGRSDEDPPIDAPGEPIPAYFTTWYSVLEPLMR